MNRLIDNKLSTWKNRPRRKPLIVRGARQVGKTHSICAFGKREFVRTAVFDFEMDRHLHRIFAEDLRAEAVLMQLEAAAGMRILPGETLLFFDEIQACPRALMALRYLYEQVPELHVVAAGSLLEFALEAISFPVGRVEFEWMRPMSFAEFLMAQGEEILCGHLPALDARSPVPTAIHEKLIGYLRLYFAVGGMPEAVCAFAETRSVAAVVEVHRALCGAYIQDFAKYSPRLDRDCLDRIFAELPGRVGQQTKYQALYPEKRIETIKRCLQVLEQASVIQKVRATAAAGRPLGAGVADKVFKYLFLDIGMAQHLCGASPRDILQERDLLKTWRGALAKQFVGQELLAQRSGSENGRLYYWARTKKSSSAEVDYVLVDDSGKIVPLEVKSGPAGRLRSMHLFLQEHESADMGLVFSTANVSVLPEQKLVFLPLYALFGHFEP